MKSAESRENSFFWDVAGRFKQHKLAVLGLIVLLLEIVMVVVVPWIIRIDPNFSNMDAFGAPPSAEHIFGTDIIGRDLFARFLSGGRISLLVGIVSSLLSLLIGAPLGMIAGYFRGASEMIIMRIADVFMSFPSMVLILVLVAVVGPSVWTITIVIGILGWPAMARLIYGSVLSVREKDYVEAAHAIGTKDLTIISRYILPNAFTPVLIAFAFRTAYAIILESSLSFLGMGVQPPQASWGNILYDAQSISVLTTMPWAWMPTAIALILTVSSINFVGNGIRDALDMKIKIQMT